MTINIALLGKDISHSKSPLLYREIYGKKLTSYDLLDLNLNEINIGKLLNNYDALNITAPYKESFVYTVQTLIGSFESINTIWKKDNVIYGTNTDYPALKKIYRSQFLKYKDVFILGDGAMAKMCLKLIPFAKVLSRRNGLLQNAKKHLKKDTLVINACSRNFDINELLRYDIFMWDLNYNVDYSVNNFSQYMDGKSLLKTQAMIATDFWKI